MFRMYGFFYEDMDVYDGDGDAITDGFVVTQKKSKAICECETY